MTVVVQWLEAQGIPRSLYIIPPHLKAYVGLLSDPALWPRLVGQQHKEKDTHRVRGRSPAGLGRRPDEAP